MENDKILALVDARIAEMEQRLIASPAFKRYKAKFEHKIMEHGTMEICTCPEWGEG